MSMGVCPLAKLQSRLASGVRCLVKSSMLFIASNDLWRYVNLSKISKKTSSRLQALLSVYLTIQWMRYVSFLLSTLSQTSLQMAGTIPSSRTGTHSLH